MNELGIKDTREKKEEWVEKNVRTKQEIRKNG
jgi:hypothetical protein